MKFNRGTSRGLREQNEACVSRCMHYYKIMVCLCMRRFMPFMCAVHVPCQTLY